MQLPKFFNTLSTRTQLSIGGVLALVFVALLTVNLTQQTQESRSRASNATISFQSASPANNTDATTLVFTKPGVMAAGNVMLAQVTVEHPATVITPPSGWTLIRRDNTSSSIATALYYKVATSSEPTSYTFTFDVAGRASGGIAAYAGVDQTKPIDASSGKYNTSTSVMTAPSVTTTTPNDMLVFFGHGVSVTTITPPTGMTEHWEVSSSPDTTSEMADQLLSTTGATGDKVGNKVATDSNISQLVALKPATVTLPTPTPAVLPTSAPVSSSVPALVQKNFLIANGTGTTSVKLPANATAGNTVLVAITQYEGTVTSVTDNLGNTYTPVMAAQHYWPTNDYAQLYYAKNITGGALTVTVKYSLTPDNNVGVYEYAGLDKTAPLDKTVGNVGSNNAPNGGSLTTTVANELVFVVGVDNSSSTGTAGSGYTLRDHSDDPMNHEKFFSEDSIRPVGTYQTNYTNGGGGDWAVIGASFKPASTTTGTTGGITLRSTSSNVNASGATSISYTKPAGVVAGDVLLAQVGVHGAASTTITAPAGWTLVRRDDTSTAYALAVYYKVATSSEPASYAFTFNTSELASGGIAAYSGVNTASPLDGNAGSFNSTGGVMTAPSVTTTVANDMLVYSAGVGINATLTQPTGMNQRWVSTNGTTNTSMLADARFTGTGATGTRVGNSSATGNSNIAQLIALKPAAASPTVAPTATPVPPTATPLPLPTATPVPPTATPKPTATPTPKPTATPVPLVTATPFPTSVPVATATTVPTKVPVPTNTPIPGNTFATVSLLLHGIGKGGDSVNAGSLGTMSPLHPQRTVTFEVFDVQNQLVATTQGLVNFDAINGNFTGKIDLGNQFNTGIYTVKVKSDQYLRGLVAGIQTITAAQTNTLPSLTLVTGDINNDNQINIVDYNILVGCYSDLLPAVDCTSTNKIKADLTDDGNVNQFDYNLFIRELTNIGGQ